MKHSAVFLCGDRSPYGLAHLEAVAEHFELLAVVVADRARWAKFRATLCGGKTYSYRSASDLLRQTATHILKMPLQLGREIRHQARLKSVGVPVYVIHDINSPSALDLIRSFETQVIISAAYPQIFKQPLLDIAPRRAINCHPSLLPRCRGAHPHYWCLATGEQMGGVTAHFMTDKIDAGDIIAQRSFELEGLYYPDLYQKIIDETPKLVSHIAEFLNNENSKPTPQDDRYSTFFRNDRDIHRRLDFVQMSARQIHDLIRAGGAYLLFRGRRTPILKADILPKNRHLTNGVIIPPGVIADIDDRGIHVATNDKKILLISKFCEHGKISTAANWVRKNAAQIGERFE